MARQDHALFIPGDNILSPFLTSLSLSALPLFRLSQPFYYLIHKPKSPVLCPLFSPRENILSLPFRRSPTINFYNQLKYHKKQNMACILQ